MSRTANEFERSYLISCGYQYDDALGGWVKSKGEFRAVVSDGANAIGILFAVQILDAKHGCLCDTQSNRNVQSAVAAADMMLAYRIADASSR